VTKTLTSHSEDETAAIARKLAVSLPANAVVLLEGDLGAGKTAFVRGLAEGIGAGTEVVSSPTFTLIQEYRGGRLPIMHVDLYRLNDPREIEDLGLDELGHGAVLAIEWADKLPHAPSDAIRVRIEHAGDTIRKLTIEMQDAE